MHFRPRGCLQPVDPEQASKQARHREKLAEMCCGKLQHFWVCKGYVLLANNSLSAKKPCQQFGNHRGPRFACTLCSLRRLHGCSSDRIELLLLEQCQWKTTTKPLCSCITKCCAHPVPAVHEWVFSLVGHELLFSPAPRSTFGARLHLSYTEN